MVLANAAAVRRATPYACDVTGAVVRVRLLGAESTGKTTLSSQLARAYETVWNPEYGRPYTELGRDPALPWASDEFTYIARLQCWYEDQLADQARRVLFCDTDAFTTALFHEVYLGRPTAAFDDLLERRYELTVVCGLDIAWRHDGIREFERQRRSMHERYLAHAAESGLPWLEVVGSEADRLEAARAAVDASLDRASRRV
jgi:HTH-type transcriptional regulator, transcriptional repressor of NAD biosynthesis genes